MLIVEGVSLDGDGQSSSVYDETYDIQIFFPGAGQSSSGNDETYAKFRKLLIAGYIILTVAAVVICVCACVIKPLCDRHSHEITEGLEQGINDSKRCTGPAIVFAIIVFGGGAVIIYFVPQWTGIKDGQWEKE